MSGDGPAVAGGARESATRCKGYCFGPSGHGESGGTLLSYAGSRWKLWSEREAAVEISHSDKTELYTAACWGTTATSNGTGKGKPKHYIALGCQSGRVQVWDPNSGELFGPVASAFAALARGADCAVCTLAPTQPNRASVLAGCRALPDVLELGLSDGALRRTFKIGKTGVLQLATSSSGVEWLVTADAEAASSLRLWDLAEMSSAGRVQGRKSSQQRAHARLAAPANMPTSLDVCSVETAGAALGRAVALCADGTMQVDVFTYTATGSPSANSADKPLSPAIALSSHEPVQVARFAAVDAVGKTAESLLTVVGYGASAVVLWRFRSGDLPADARPGSARALAALVAVAADDFGGRVLCARLGSTGSDDGCAAVVAAFGPAARPSFSVARASTTKGERPAIEPCSAATALEQKRPKAASVDQTAGVVDTKGREKVPTVLGPLQATIARKRPGDKRRLDNVEDLYAEEFGQQKRPKLPGEGADAKGKPAVGLSLASVVRQALRSGESAPLGKVISESNPRVIESTIAELSGAEASILLQECTQRLVAAPLEGTVICAWVQAVLVRHCVHFRSQPALRSSLEPLRDLLQARSKMRLHLVRLRGRLQLLRDLGNHAIEVRHIERESLRVPVVEYVEGEELEAEESDDEAAMGEENEDEESGIDPDDIFDDDSSDE